MKWWQLPDRQLNDRLENAIAVRQQARTLLDQLESAIAATEAALDEERQGDGGEEAPPRPPAG